MLFDAIARRSYTEACNTYDREVHNDDVEALMLRRLRVHPAIEAVLAADFDVKTVRFGYRVVLKASVLREALVRAAAAIEDEEPIG